MMSGGCDTIVSILFILLTSFTITPSAFSVPPMSTSYPRLLHPGGFSLPPMMEDLLSIATVTSSNINENKILQKDLLLVRPPDMESLWEWYAYTKRQTDSDPSWGRIWPTALSLARFVLQSLNSGQNYEMNQEIIDIMMGLEDQEQELVEQAIGALQRSSHVIEVGCGLGVNGLSFAIAAKSMSIKRTVTFLDREAYALHCVMASASINNLATAPISNDARHTDDSAPLITVRSSIDDWTSADKNICYKDLCLDSLDIQNKQTLILASDILYEPSSMDSLTTKLRNLLEPKEGGYVLITDPEKERTSGCRIKFVKSVQDMGGQVVILPLPQPNSSGKALNKPILVESDVDIDGNLAKTVLIVVHFNGE